MRNKIARGITILGICLLIGALGLTGYNLWDSKRAEDASKDVVEQIGELVDLPEISPEEDDIVSEDPSDDGSILSEELPLYEQYPEMEMPTVTIDGYRYIGVLYVPSLDLSLPIMEEWDYTRLRIAPCRYYGSAYTHDLVIAGHNYRKHFNKLKSLPSGSRVIFTDADGNIFRYEIGWIDVLDPTEGEILISESESNPWDLTLFTCTTGGTARHVIRCELIDD